MVERIHMLQSLAPTPTQLAKALEKKGDGWETDGSLDERERARRKARRILQEHCPTPIPAEIDTAIRRKFDILLPQDLANVNKD